MRKSVCQEILTVVESPLLYPFFNRIFDGKNDGLSSDGISQEIYSYRELSSRVVLFLTREKD